MAHWKRKSTSAAHQHAEVENGWRKCTRSPKGKKILETMKLTTIIPLVAVASFFVGGIFFFSYAVHAQILEISRAPIQVASTTVDALGIDTPFVDQVKYEQNEAVLKELKQMNIYLSNIVGKL